MSSKLMICAFAVLAIFMILECDAALTMLERAMGVTEGEKALCLALDPNSKTFKAKRLSCQVECVHPNKTRTPRNSPRGQLCCIGGILPTSCCNNEGQCPMMADFSYCNMTAGGGGMTGRSETPENQRQFVEGMEGFPEGFNPTDFFSQFFG